MFLVFFLCSSALPGVWSFLCVTLQTHLNTTNFHMPSAQALLHPAALPVWTSHFHAYKHNIRVHAARCVCTHSSAVLLTKSLCFAKSLRWRFLYRLYCTTLYCPATVPYIVQPQNHTLIQYTSMCATPAFSPCQWPNPNTRQPLGRVPHS